MSTAIKWGLITGMVYVVFSLVSNLLGIQGGMGGGSNVGMSYLVLLLITVATFFTIYLGVKEYRDQDKGGYITLGEGFIQGLQIALIAGVISAIFMIIYTQVIDPDFTTKISESAEAQWEEMGMSEEQIENARKMSGWFTNPLALAAYSLFMAAFSGLIKSLIAGAILKRDRPMTMPPSAPPSVPG